MDRLKECLSQESLIKNEERNRIVQSKFSTLKKMHEINFEEKKKRTEMRNQMLRSKIEEKQKQASERAAAQIKKQLEKISDLKSKGSSKMQSITNRK